MKKLFFTFLVSLSFVLLIISCEKDSKNDVLPRPSLIPKSFTEEFDTVANLSPKGWVIINNSEPFGPVAWRQGKYELGGKLGNEIIGFPAFSAVYNQNEFVSVDMNAGSDIATLSCWLITPASPMKNGDQVIFFSRCNGDFIDRMQVRGNFTTGTANVGTKSTEVGDFTTFLLDINANMTATGYPDQWTKFTITLAGLPSALVNGRIAFRYYVPNGGPGGDNSDMVGIDVYQFISK